MFAIEEKYSSLCCKWFKRSLRLVALIVLILAWLGLMFAEELTKWNQQATSIIPKAKAAAEEANQESVFTSANFHSYYNNKHTSGTATDNLAQPNNEKDNSLSDTSSNVQSVSYPDALENETGVAAYWQNFSYEGISEGTSDGPVVGLLWSEALPDGLTLDQAAGLISETPEIKCFAEHNYSIVVNAMSATTINAPVGVLPIGTAQFKANGLPVGNAVSLINRVAGFNITASPGSFNNYFTNNASYSVDNNVRFSSHRRSCLSRSDLFSDSQRHKEIYESLWMM